MKRVYSTALGLMLFASSVQAAQQDFLWNYTQKATTPAVSFKVSLQENCTGSTVDTTVSALQSSGSFQQSFTALNIKVNVDYCSWVAAITAAGKESKPSNTVRFQVQEEPEMPTNFRLK